MRFSMRRPTAFNPDRRGLLVGLAATGLAAPFIASRPVSAADAPPDLAQARKEGALVVMHSDQENDVVTFLRAFTEKTGIQALQQRALPGSAMPKLQAELRAGASEIDAYMCSDPGLMDVLRQRKQLLAYISPEMDAYAPNLRSDPVGYWTTYFINIGPMMYDPRYVDAATAPKTWTDLLDPRWSQQVGFQNSSAGTQYTWWYLLKDIMPKDYWMKLARQKPRAYASSTQILSDIQSGNLKIGGKVSNYQYVKAKRLNQAIEVVYPPEGAPAQTQVVGILVATQRPNAAKVFIDYFLSQEGQTAWNRIQGSSSTRKDVTIPNVPKLEDVKILLPTDFKDYASPARHAEFVKLWNSITGM
ncbi:extracellular solute-binding protein [Methylobacterium sp. J-030]|uniref:ABC transporter substrate-binding protein n=1 Tax=Methylobacterium sp. J-030 TaxID=2836627 RepID=UPI001FBA13FC|nr:extracellular solute-binding protein [Methylobacterium sp. J-030]MCJ2069608.1 extracellular solute-binding protein [Methylobacterium sp. J-030]